VLPTSQFAEADDGFDGNIVPMVVLVLGGMLEGGATDESGIPFQRLSYVELGYDS
jgi:hypothetical protein